VHDYVITTTGLKHPATGLQGKFSVNHCVAVALFDGHVRLAQFTDDRVHDPAIHEMRERIRVQHDPAQAKDSASMRVTLTDGTELIRHTRHNKGTPGNPMSNEEIEAKFLDLAGTVLEPEQAQRLAELCWGLEDVADVTGLMALGSTGHAP
jgi:2-methylcitrate dehydratase PrpD